MFKEWFSSENCILTYSSVKLKGRVMFAGHSQNSEIVVSDEMHLRYDWNAGMQTYRFKASAG